jgi:hypothetical protein
MNIENRCPYEIWLYKYMAKIMYLGLKIKNFQVKNTAY